MDDGPPLAAGETWGRPMDDDDLATLIAQRIADRIRDLDVDGRKILVVLVPKGLTDDDVAALKRTVDLRLERLVQRRDGS